MMVLSKSLNKSVKDLKTELTNLIQFAGYYQRFNFPEQEPNSELRRGFDRLKRLDFSTCQMFLLNIYYLYDRGNLSLEQFQSILNYLESYFIRRWVVGESTRALGKFFDSLYSKVIAANPENVVLGLREVLISKNNKTPVFPNDESFWHSLIHKALYKSNSRDRVKLMIERIEQSLTKEVVDFGNLTVEHIMPQKLPKNQKWERILGDRHKTIHKTWLNTLGNLTLTAKNSELSNKPFEEKLKILRESNLSLNHYFRNIDIWNEEAIQKRAESLADIAIKIWHCEP